MRKMQNYQLFHVLILPLIYHALFEVQINTQCLAKVFTRLQLTSITLQPQPLDVLCLGSIDQ